MTAMAGRTGAADLQVHTRASDAMDPLDDIFNAAEQAGLDCIAITDHDQTRGAHIAAELAARQQRPFDVIVGSEISSRQGHLLALWIDQPIPAFRSAAETAEAIWRQGGVCVIAHPAAVVPFSLSQTDIAALLGDLSQELRGGGAPTLAIESANPIPSARWRRSRIIQRNQRWQLPQTGGSDAHFHEQVGTAITRYAGQGAGDLRRALDAGETLSELRAPASLRQIGAKRLLAQQWRGITATPRALIDRRRR